MRDVPKVDSVANVFRDKPHGGGAESGGEKFAVVSAVQDGKFRAAEGVPDAGSPVPGRRHDAPTIRAERDGANPAFMPAKHHQLPAVGDIPDADRLVLRCGDDAMTVRAERG